MDTRDVDSIDSLASEYVLGTLSANARKAVESRVANDDHALRTAIQNWEERLLPLTRLAEAVEPSSQLWSRIEKSVDANIESNSPRKREVVNTGSWWNSVKLWRGLAGSGFAMAAILAAVLVTRIGAPPAPQYMVVLVTPQDKAPGYVVQTGTHRDLTLIPLGNAPVPEAKSLQFWTKGEAWRGPVSLGLVKPGQTIQIPIDKLPPLEPNQLFELTLEPANGSPIDRPTGPIQFIGRAVKVI